MKQSLIVSIVTLVILLSNTCMAFEQLIKQPMSVSGDLESQYIHILSFHPNTTTSNITAYNANINRLLERFDEYHLLYKLGQGAHAATRVHTVLTR